MRNKFAIDCRRDQVLLAELPNAVVRVAADADDNFRFEDGNRSTEEVETDCVELRFRFSLEDKELSSEREIDNQPKLLTLISGGVMFLPLACRKAKGQML